MSTLIHKWVADCRAGRNPRLVGRVKSGWVVLGEVQVVPGYCLVLPDPVVPHLNVMEKDARELLWRDVGGVGDGLLTLTDALRCNYELLGNLEPALHVHIFPRYASEPQALRSKPIWFYDWEAAPRFDATADADLINSLRSYLDRAGLLQVSD